MNIIKYPMKEVEYVKEECSKSQIVLHHTVSANGKNTADYFSADKGKSRIAVPYVIDKDGNIYELFEPQYWAYHLGLPHVDNVLYCKKSIGIEITNEGPLVKREGSYYWWIDPKTSPRGKNKFNGTAVDLGKPWRGCQYFAGYTDAQVKATAELTKYLCEKFNIPKEFDGSFDFNTTYMSKAGIISHCNVREDKTDISPAFDVNKFKDLLK